MENSRLTGYPSIDKPQCAGSTFFQKNPIIPSINIYTLLRLTSKKYRNKAAVDCLELKATYQDLLNDAVTVSLALKELGVSKHDIIAVSMPNLYQALVAFFACNRIGAITTFLDAAAQDDEIISYLNQFESKVYFNYNRNDEHCKNVLEKTKVQHIITLSEADKNMVGFPKRNDYEKDEKCISYMSLGAISANRKSKFEPHHGKSEDALILFTSGSTGKPKSVLLTNENVIASEIYAKNTSHTENIVSPTTLICVPFSYPYGFVTSALTSLLWGKESILAPSIGKGTVKYYFEKKPSIIFGSPALLDMVMYNVPEKQDLSFVTHFISGGDFLTVQHAKRGVEFFSKHGADNVEIGNGFGNAETVSIGSTPVGVPLRQETAGKLLVGPTFMVVDPDTKKELSYGKEGLLFVSGKHVFKEYYKSPELTKEVKTIIKGKEFYNTGTLGFIDEQGYFTVTGRQSRFYIMSSLNKVYCDHVQSIIQTYACVKDCAVVKVPDDEQLYVNKAFIVLNDEYEPSEKTLEELQSYFRQPTQLLGSTAQLKPYEIPTYIEFVDSLPRIPKSEKVDYRTLEQKAAETK